jgi:pyruvate ferredoxin oxidoreductase alpha subunit
MNPKYPTLNLEEPISLGVMPYPPYHNEFQYDKHISLENSQTVVEEAFDAFERTFGRRYDPIETFATEDADIIIVGMGSMTGTARYVVNKLREEGERVGLVKIKMYRPFPYREVARVARSADVVGVLDRDVSIGTGGILYSDIVRSLYHSPEKPKIANFVLGLGGRDVSPVIVRKVVSELKKFRKLESVEDRILWPDADMNVLKAWGIGN